MNVTELRNQLIAIVAGNSDWKKRLVDEAVKIGCDIRFQTIKKPADLKEGDVALADNGVIAIISFDGDVTDEIKKEFSEETVEKLLELFQKGTDNAILLEAVKKN